MLYTTDIGVKEISSLGHYIYSRSQNRLRMHTHKNRIELVLVGKGEQDYVVSNHVHHLTGGDILLTQPQDKHGTGRSIESKGEIYWLQIRIPGKKRIVSEENDTSKLIREISRIDYKFIRDDGRVLQCFRRLIETCLDKKEKVRHLLIKTLLNLLLLDLIQLAEKKATGIHSKQIETALTYIENNVSQPIQLAELAKEAGLSLSRLKTRFKNETGLTPNDYINRKKIQIAGERLKNGKSVTDTAFDLGYCSSQYFAYVFKKYTGNTPRQAKDVSANGIYSEDSHFS